MTVSLFDVIGPIMVGPSSSHTAGAIRLGNMARKVSGEAIQAVKFYLHGSFARTYRGHGTDRALLGGVLGLAPADERIREAFQLARQQNIEYDFFTIDLGNVHPNTAHIMITRKDGSTCEISGSSIGGGKVVITSINKLPVEFSGNYTTTIVIHQDKPGVIAYTTSVFSHHHINIAFLRVFRQLRGQEASMIIETDEMVDHEVIATLQEYPDIKQILLIEPLP
ncbi:MAG TPA: L-serine ammonia-lyase, iron-sulfur-dependent, subunit beta [Syntrophomonadaceae bacterium]|jgi:L-serine dehydratase|nr:L-serine ammonia-lyase, iron-sulfur-dependent, subunit beta [Syntrophomonadaceae bacterium]